MRYDSNGLRTQKGDIHYYYDSDNNLIATVNGEHTLFFYYDENGSATSFSLGGNMYFYVKNLQGDIVNIVDSSGTVLVRYDYDVFGKITAIKKMAVIRLSPIPQVLRSLTLCAIADMSMMMKPGCIISKAATMTR